MTNAVACVARDFGGLPFRTLRKVVFIARFVLTDEWNFNTHHWPLCREAKLNIE